MPVPIRIAGAKNPVNQIPFEIELDDGEVVAFTVPKAQYVPKPVMDEYEPWLIEWQKTAMSASKSGAKAREKLRETDPILKLLEMLVPAEVYRHLEALTVGELIEIDRRWRERSDAEMGESEASASSSTENMRGPSDSISSNGSDSTPKTSAK